MRIESSADIEAIAGYTSVAGWLEIVDTDLECLDFLACLQSVGHDVGIYDNAQLRDLAGFNAVIAVGTYDAARYGSVIVTRNHALSDLDGFAALPDLSGSLAISSNDALLRVSGFDALGRVSGTVTIRSNPELENLGPLEELSAIGDLCQINNNPSLCMTEIHRVCGDLDEGPAGGSTENNDEAC